MIALQLVPSVTSDPAYSRYVKALVERRERLGYKRFMPDVWDVPTWALPVLRAGGQLVIGNQNTRATGMVYGSVMACNKADWQAVVNTSPDATFVLGGYTSAIGGPNVSWQGQDDTALRQLKPFSVRYPLGGTVHGARVTLSKGCRHNCTFCTVPHGKVTELFWPDIANQLSGGSFGWVYVDDKTFGQADNTDLLASLREIVSVEGYVVQTTASEVLRHSMDYWHQDLGIKAVELGVESFNDGILRDLRKPTNTGLIEQACKRLAQAGILVCPNILLGAPGENARTYLNTMDFMADVPGLGWFNVYCLANYRDDDLAREDVLGPNTTLTDAIYRESILHHAANLMSSA